MEKLNLYIEEERCNLGKLENAILEREGEEHYLKIMSGCDGDLYFGMWCDLNPEKDSDLIIKKNDNEVYNIFDTLFETIKNYDPSDDAREKYAYPELFHDDMIEWKCDEHCWDNAPSFIIKKLNDDYIMSFVPVEDDDNPLMPFIISVRLRTSGCSYGSLNRFFIEFYRSLCMLAKELESKNNCQEETLENGNCKKLSI